jgi:hypothetical protein
MGAGQSGSWWPGWPGTCMLNPRFVAHALSLAVRPGAWAGVHVTSVWVHLVFSTGAPFPPPLGSRGQGRSSLQKGVLIFAPPLRVGTAPCVPRSWRWVGSSGLGLLVQARVVGVVRAILLIGLPPCWAARPVCVVRELLSWGYPWYVPPSTFFSV